MKDLMTRVKKDVRRVLHNNRGFTLIELLIVLAIIAIIAGIAVPRYTASLQKAKESACAANIAILESAAMRYWVDNLDEGDKYPAGISGAEDGKECLVPDYIKEAPVCPLGGTYTISTSDGSVSCSHGATQSQ